MNQENYKELNRYLNEIFSILEKQNPVALKWLGSFCEWTEIFYSISGNRHFDNLSGSFGTVPFTLFYSELKQFLFSINPIYVVKLEGALQNGIFNLGEDVKESKHDSSGSFTTIDIQREYTWKDAFVLIHEFFHYLNDSNTESRGILTEGISIYFEFAFYDYLMNKGMEIDFPIISRRIVNTYFTASDFRKYSLEFLLFKEVGDLDASSYAYLPQISSYKISKEVYNYECICLLEKCRDMEEMYRKENGVKKFDKKKFEEIVRDTFFMEYQYIMGTFLALYMREFGSLEKMVWLNENVNNPLSLTDLLEKIGIECKKQNLKAEMKQCLWEEIEKNSVPFKQR